MPVSQSSALYYPFIEIHNEPWLRHAVLYWETVSTIVPESIHDPYQAPFARELAEAGVLQQAVVNSSIPEIEELADSILEYLTDPAAANILLPPQAKKGVRLHRDKLPPSVAELARIHPDKLPYILRSQLVRSIDGEGFLRVDPKFADYYMTLLATRIAKRLGFSVVTDSAPADSLAVTAMKGIPTKSLSLSERQPINRRLLDSRPTNPKSKIAEGLLVDLSFQGLSIPKKVTAKELLAFREKHSAELAIYRTEIASLACDIPEDSTLDSLREAVQNRYKQKVLPALNSLKRSLAAQAWDSAVSTVVKLTALSAGPASAMVVAGVPTAVALLAAAGVSMTATAVSLVTERRKARSSSPYAYLLAADRRWG